MPGAAWLATAAIVAGVVYGFSGFGAGLIFMPVAVRLIEPVTAVPVFAIMAFGSVFTVLPQAWGGADRRASLTMLAACGAAIPLGVMVLRLSDPDLLRWFISLAVLATLGLLLTGWRFAATPGLPAWLGVGASAGLMGGAAGLPGPPLILFQLGGKDGAARSRANTIVVLTLTSFFILPTLAWQGALDLPTLSLGLMLMPVYAIGGWIGRRMFRPSAERFYRAVASVLIGLAAVAGLPVFG